MGLQWGVPRLLKRLISQELSSSAFLNLSCLLYHIKISFLVAMQFDNSWFVNGMCSSLWEFMARRNASGLIDIKVSFIIVGTGITLKS